MRSYRTVSPLPAGSFHPAGGLFSVALSLGSPPPAVNRHRIPVEPGLSSIASRRQRPSGRLARPTWAGMAGGVKRTIDPITWLDIDRMPDGASGRYPVRLVRSHRRCFRHGRALTLPSLNPGMCGDLWPGQAALASG